MTAGGRSVRLCAICFSDDGMPFMGAGVRDRAFPIVLAALLLVGGASAAVLAMTAERTSLRPRAGPADAGASASPEKRPR